MIFVLIRDKLLPKSDIKLLMEKLSIRHLRISIGEYLSLPKKILATMLKVKDELWEFRWDMFAMFDTNILKENLKILLKFAFF
jgi:hypothetical protein